MKHVKMPRNVKRNSNPLAAHDRYSQQKSVNVSKHRNSVVVVESA
jgi:hypothetical protein